MVTIPAMSGFWKPTPLLLAGADVGAGIDAATVAAMISAAETAAAADTALQVGFSDDFNRSAVPMGAPWVDRQGTFGCDGANAYVDSLVLDYNIATAQCAADGTFQVTMDNLSAAAASGLIFRWSDNSNFLAWLGAEGGLPFLLKMNAGAFSVLYTGAVNLADGDVLKVVTLGNSISVYRNGGLESTENDGFNSSAVNAGLVAQQASAAVTLWDDFSYSP